MPRIPTVLFGCALASVAAAQPALYSNGSANPTEPGLATGTASLSGVSAPAGARWSEASSDGSGTNAIAGFACHQNGLTGSYRFADDFTVPPGPGWNIRGVSLFAYQTNAALAPFDAVTLRIWSGAPGTPGSTVVWGDPTTNRLSAVVATDTYRIFNSLANPVPALPDTTRRIWRLDAAAEVVLAPGTYWLDWQIESIAADSEAFTPAVTVAGQRSLAAWNGRQFKPSFNVGVWEAVVDTGKPFAAADVLQDLPFQLRGSVGCVADVDDGSGSGTPDGGVGIEDLLYFLDSYGSGTLAADIDDGTATGTPDGGVGVEDLLYYLLRFDGGC